MAFAGSRSVLDVGCGTGRDAAYLLKRGKHVIGIDGSEAMLAAARQIFAAAKLDPEGRLHHAALPDLGIFEDARFDGLLCNAVLMHLPEESLFDTVYSLKRVLRSGGTLLLTIPESRPGIDPKTHRDAGGRLYTGLPAAKLQLLFERVGFRLESSEVVDDPLGRDGYIWNRSLLKRLDDSVARPLHLVERILNRDDKVATYKLALFRALAEIAQTQHHLASFLPDGKVSLPVAALAEKWLLYYWPIFDAAEAHSIRQGTSSQGADVAIRAPMQKIIREYSSDGGLSRFYVEWKSNRLSPPVEKLVRSALSKLRSTIWSMPAKHAGGGHFTVFQYDRPAKSLIMEAAIWRELCLMGSWIQDATVLRWAELTEQINKGAIKTSEVVERLLTVPNAARNVADARAYFAALPERCCVWTERPLSHHFAVDHAMPFALWRNNDLWNLFPADTSANQRKSDRLPTYDLLQPRRDRIVHYWQGLHEALDERFSREAQTLLGRDRFQPTTGRTASSRVSSRPSRSPPASAARIVGIPTLPIGKRSLRPSFPPRPSRLPMPSKKSAFTAASRPPHTRPHSPKPISCPFTRSKLGPTAPTYRSSPPSLRVKLSMDSKPVTSAMPRTSTGSPFHQRSSARAASSSV